MPEWSSIMVIEATLAYGRPRYSRNADLRFASFELQDRHVVLISPERGSRAPALVHLGPNDPDLPSYGLGADRRASSRGRTELLTLPAPAPR